MTRPGILDQFVERATELYTLPRVALEVLELTRAEDVDLGAIKACISNDPALTARLLKIVNSSLFGLSRQVSDLQQALALLGVGQLKMLVLGFSLPKTMFTGISGTTLGQYWRRSLTKAVACREFSNALWNDPGDESFVSGLLQGIGMLALIQDLGESYVAFLDRVYSEGGDLLSLETASLGFDHEVLSARLLAAWLLPENLVAAVGCPHRDDHILSLPEQQRIVPQQLHLAELLTAAVIDGRAGAVDELIRVAELYCQIDVARLEKLVLEIQPKVEQLGEILQLDLPDHGDYAELLSAAQQEMASIKADCGGAELALLDQVREIAVEAADKVAAIQEVAIAKAAETTPAGLRSRATAAGSAARSARKPLSLLLLEIDSFSDMLWHCGGDSERLVALAQRGITQLSNGSTALHEGDGRFAMLVQNCDRHDAVEFARNLSAGVRDWSGSHEEFKDRTLTLSCGVATVMQPAPNFEGESLVEAAERCLRTSQRFGGDTVKSIEIY